ncbi:DUF2268 domain-containing putative Zn-dependent protease [Psychrobacillus sp. FSL K6-2365]|uniref:DUF2268 domain-containing protein n=1 Tax=Psychrobacillus sp. FSL K6-2365 TaxID=2921546 RepID=UPI0030F8D826
MKKVFYFCITLSMSIFLISCSNESEKFESSSDRIIQSPIAFKHGEQEFEIINYYQETLDFLKATKEQPDNLEVLYKQSVLDTLRKNGFGYSELSDWMFTTPSDIEALEETMSKLIDKQVLLNDSIKEALLESATLLPGGNKTIHVLPSWPEFGASMKEVNYVGGYVWNKDSILIQIDPSFLEEDLKYTVAHEYHHTVYREMNADIWYSLLENTLVEGKADIFAKTIYPNVYVPWSEPLIEQENQKVWEIFRENMESTDSSFIEGFTHGNPYYGIPQWSTYRIGNQIMQSFLDENSGLSIEEWTKVSESDIFQKSKYYNK